MGQLKVVPEFPVKDDVVPPEPQKVRGGLLFDTGAVPEVKHACKTPHFINNDPYQWHDQYIEDCKRIPEGSFWQCPCGTVYKARSKRKGSNSHKRRWARMRWYSLILRKEWEAVQDTFFPDRFDPAR